MKSDNLDFLLMDPVEQFKPTPSNKLVKGDKVEIIGQPGPGHIPGVTGKRGTVLKQITKSPNGPFCMVQIDDTEIGTRAFYLRHVKHIPND